MRKIMTNKKENGLLPIKQTIYEAQYETNYKRRRKENEVWRIKKKYNKRMMANENKTDCDEPKRRARTREGI